MLEVKHLTKSYGNKRVVDDVSFTVERGQILGFLGPNGAGKSTTMNMITGYLGSTSGTAVIDGVDILKDPVKAKAKMGYLPERPPLYMDMTVREYLNFMYELKNVKYPRQSHISEICERVQITDVYNRLIKNLSKGYRQRIGIAQALLGNPDLLILDEPTVGLDPKQIIDIRSLIKTLGQKQTVILSSHILPEVQAVCDRIIVINHGKLAADDTPEHLSQAMSSDHKLTVRIDGPEKEVTAFLKALPGMLEVQNLGERETNVFEYNLETSRETDIRRELFHRLAEKDWPLLASRSSGLSLEDVFLTLTTDSLGAGEQLTPDEAAQTNAQEGEIHHDSNL